MLVESVIEVKYFHGIRVAKQIGFFRIFFPRILTRCFANPFPRIPVRTKIDIDCRRFSTLKIILIPSKTNKYRAEFFKKSFDVSEE